ncbi:MAG: hypothetical protein ACYS0K_21935 [Planctomycetota bacterium]|jgi:hypothetical protein
MTMSDRTRCPNDVIPPPDHTLISDLLGLPAQKVHETLANYSLRDLSGMTEHELRAAGLTPARARKLRTAFELAKRFQNGKPVLRGQPFATPKQIFDAYNIRFRDEKREHFMIMSVSRKTEGIGGFFRARTVAGKGKPPHGA